MSESGYQQFDLADFFDMFENPHGLEEVSETEKTQLRLLYSNKKHKHCEARFSPARSSPDLFMSLVSSLQYVYLRNFVQRAIVKRVSLLHFPTCFAVADFNTLFLGGYSEDEHPGVGQAGGEQVLAVIGTKEGKVLSYKISSSGSQKLAETRGGLAFGSISAIDMAAASDRIVAATESGELFTAEIIKNCITKAPSE